MKYADLCLAEVKGENCCCCYYYYYWRVYLFIVSWSMTSICCSFKGCGCLSSSAHRFPGVRVLPGPGGRGCLHSPVLISPWSPREWTRFQICPGSPVISSLPSYPPLPSLIAIFCWDFINSYLSEFSLLILTVSQILQRLQAKLPQIHTH